VAKSKRILTWIKTTGGPHLVVPEKHAAHWEGVAEPSHGRVVQAKFRYDPTGPATDYDRACDVAGWLGVIRVGRGRGVVLTGDRTTAAYHPWNDRHFILRWRFAPSEGVLLEQFHVTVGRLAVEQEVTVRHTGGRLFLMDASDIPRGWLGEHSAFELPAGAYRVTAAHSESEEVSVIVHEWVRVRTRANAVDNRGGV
jgi:hypothetical protein